MIATISPSVTQEMGSTNTMRYAQMVAGGGSGASKKAKAAGMQARRAKEQISQIKAIYKEHCPEKTEAEVDGILAKFKGKEANLLRKVRMKYATQKKNADKEKEVVGSEDEKRAKTPD